jgi:rhamnosyltransferase
MAFWDDNKTKLIKKSYKQKKYDHFFESPGAGCTFLARSANMQNFKDFILNNWEEVNKIESHDWLMYAFYRERDIKWIIDDKPLILYRQHGLNQVGANSGFKAYVKRIKLIRSGWYKAEIYKIFKLTACKNKILFELDGLFLLKNVYQLRRRNRDILLMLFVIIFRFF